MANWRTVVFVPMAVVFFLVRPATAFSPDSVFQAANAFYEKQEYEQASRAYLTLAEEKYESATLYFNIGNCYFKEGRFGYAILYYLKAQRLDPGDEDIQTNLAFARQFMPTRLEGVKFNPMTTFFDMVVKPFTLETLAWISSVLFVILFLLLSYIVFRRLGGWQVKTAVYTFIAVLLFSSALTTFKYRADILTKSGVVVADNANVYNAPNVDGELEFVGSFGLEVEVERADNDFYLVIFENKRKGWVKKADIGLI